MIITVTPNAAIDKTYTIEGFGLDRVHRPSYTRTVPGGKGINVSRVLKELGKKSLATGFIGGETGDAIIKGLEEEEIIHDFVRVKDESRLCIAVVDPTNGTQTEVNENGPEVSSCEINSMLDKIRNNFAGVSYIILSGSCPPGTPVTFYGDIINIAKQAGIKTVLDTSGDHLREAVKASPYMLKPNIFELSQLVGRELFTLEEICHAAKSLKSRYGIEITAVTMGRSGAIVTDGDHIWKAVPPAIEFASAVGSGDSFVASFIYSIMSGGALPDALSLATAAGAANAATYGAGFCKKESIMELLKGVTLTNVN